MIGKNTRCQTKILVNTGPSPNDSKTILCSESDEAKLREYVFKYIIDNCVIENKDNDYIYLTYYKDKELCCTTFPI